MARWTNSMYDNRDTFQRQLWYKGELVTSVDFYMIVHINNVLKSGVQLPDVATEWLAEWGTYPDAPNNKE